MKINKILIIISIILCMSITANAEGLEESNIKNGKRYEFENEFSMLVPENYEFSEVEQNNFVNSKVYEYESNEERLRVIISSQQSTDANFKDLDYLIRKDLDYKLLTNEQLLREYETFEQVIADSVPVYMDYLPVSSVTIDERLALVCNAYYTENESYATGMIKAYRFYYMGNLVTIYYDTLIEGNYYNEKAFSIFDEIVRSIDFASNPTSNANNPAILARIVSIMIKPLAVVAAALFIGIILGVVTRGSKGKRVSGKTGADAVVEFDNKVEPVVAQEVVPEPEPALDIDEGADWSLLLTQAKNENEVIYKNKVESQEPQKEKIEEVVQETVEKDDYDIIVEEIPVFKQEQIDKHLDIMKKIDNALNDDEDEQKIEHKDKQEQEQQQYDYEFEHEMQSDYVKNLLEKEKQKEWQEQQDRQNRIDKVNQMLDNKLNELNESTIKNDDLSENTHKTVGGAMRRLGYLDQEIEGVFPKKDMNDQTDENKEEQGLEMDEKFSYYEQLSDTNDVDETIDSDNEIFETLKKGSEQTLENLGEIEIDNKEEEKELDDNKDFFTSKLVRKKVDSSESVDTEYIDRMLPEKNKIENKKNIKALQKEVLNFLHEEISEKVEKTNKVNKVKKENAKLKGASKFLNSIVDRIVGEGNIEEEILADVECRNELHRSEKIDNNKYDELIPGITDAYEEKEVVEIIMDEDEEVKYLYKDDKKKD